MVAPVAVLKGLPWKMGGVTVQYRQHACDLIKVVTAALDYSVTSPYRLAIEKRKVK